MCLPGPSGYSSRATICFLKSFGCEISSSVALAEPQVEQPICFANAPRRNMFLPGARGPKHGYHLFLQRLVGEIFFAVAPTDPKLSKHVFLETVGAKICVSRASVHLWAEQQFVCEFFGWLVATFVSPSPQRTPQVEQSIVLKHVEWRNHFLPGPAVPK